MRTSLYFRFCIKGDPGARSSSDRCPMFCYGFRLNDMFTGNSVQRGSPGFEIRFLLFVGVLKKSAQSAAACIETTRY